MKPHRKAVFIAFLLPVCGVLIAGIYLLILLILRYFSIVKIEPNPIGFILTAGLTILLAFVGCGIAVGEFWKTRSQSGKSPLIGTSVLVFLLNLFSIILIENGILTSRPFNDHLDFWNWCVKVNSHVSRSFDDECSYFSPYDCHAKKAGRNAKLAERNAKLAQEVYYSDGRHDHKLFSSNLRDLLISDKSLTDDPEVTFSFGVVNHSSYTFTTRHKRGKAVFTWSD